MARLLDDASSQYLLSNTTLGLSDWPLSVFVRFKLDDTSFNHCLFSLASSASNSGYHYIVATDDPDRQIIMTSLDPIASGTWTPNVWGSALGVWASNTSRILYRDGANKVTSGATSRAFGSQNRVGLGVIARISKTFYTSGAIAQYAAWAAVLGDDEAAALHEGWHPRLIKPTSLVACWDLGGFAGQNDRDYFGQYDLTAYNNPTWADHPPVLYPCGPHVPAAPSTTRVPWHLFGGAAA